MKNKIRFTAILVFSLVTIGGCWMGSYQRAGSGSVSTAKRYGTFISELDVSPSEFTLDGNTFKIREAWLEHEYWENWFILPYSKRKTDNVYLCYTFEDSKGLHGTCGCNIFDSHLAGSSIGVPEGNCCFHCKLNNPDNISWHGIFGGENGVPVTFTRK